MLNRWLCVVVAVMAATAWLPSASAADSMEADNYPDRPIRLIVPTGPGAITDVLARTVAEKIGRSMGQSVVVENRPGASGIIGSNAVATASPDGYTLLMAFPSHTVNMHLYKTLPYDTVKSFDPISRVGMVSQLFLVRADHPAQTLQDFIDMARAKPGQFNFGSVGQGTLAHLTSERFASEAKLDLVHVPYKSGAQMEVALLAGEVDMVFLAPITTLQMIKAGRMRALAVANETRMQILPDVPTMHEAGMPNFVMQGWNGILAPAGTPPAIIAKLNREIRNAVESPEMQQQFGAQGVDTLANTPEEFAEVITRDIELNARMIKTAGIKPE